MSLRAFSFGLLCLVLLACDCSADDTEPQPDLQSGEDDLPDVCGLRTGFRQLGRTYNTSYSAGTADECCTACGNDFRCVAWSLLHFVGRCELKDEDLGWERDARYSSGSLVTFDPLVLEDALDASQFTTRGDCELEAGASYPGGRVMQRKRAKNARRCCVRCLATSDCFSWHFNKRTKKCVLNSDTPEKVQNDAFVGNSLF